MGQADAGNEVDRLGGGDHGGWGRGGIGLWEGLFENGGGGELGAGDFVLKVDAMGGEECGGH